MQDLLPKDLLKKKSSIVTRTIIELIEDGIWLMDIFIGIWSIRGLYAFAERVYSGLQYMGFTALL